MIHSLYELLVWLDNRHPRVKNLIQNNEELAVIIHKIVEKYPLLIVQQSFKFAHRISMQLYETEKDMPCAYPEFLIRILDSQCERLLTIYKKKHYPIIIDGFDHSEPFDLEREMDRQNGIYGLLPYPSLQA